jgi:hypothetical protein
MGVIILIGGKIVVTNVKFYLFMSKIVLMLQVSSTLLTMFLKYYENMWYSWFQINLMMIEYLKTFIKHCNQCY